jgi:hypothetical protein
MKSVRICNFKLGRPRRNLPATVRYKRGESNFVSAFSAAYIALARRGGIGGREFAMSNFGIADFVWIEWRRDDGSGTAMSAEKLKSALALHRLTAFEMKLSDWRKGLAQAYRYGYFADAAMLIVPPETAKLAKAELDLFRQLRVGLWSFNSRSKKIRKFFTPRENKPRNKKAREKALDLFAAVVHFRKPRK